MPGRINLTQSIWASAVLLGALFTGGTVRARPAASPLPQEQHEQDYSNNKNYQRGLREGRDDQEHNRDHYKKRHFKKDEDQNAYESGYQQSHQGDQRQGNQRDQREH